MPAIYNPPLRDMRFVMHELLDVTSTLKQIPAYADIDADTIDQVVEQAGKFCAEVLLPLNLSGDQEGCHFDASTHAVTVPKGDGQRAGNARSTGDAMARQVFTDFSVFRVFQNAQCPGRVIGTEFFARHADTACVRSSRKIFNAVRTHVLTVPSGSPIRSAISVCERPS